MEEKLIDLYNECINELKTIGINVLDNPDVGKIQIKFSRRNAKRYGCCKQENPDKFIKHKKKYRGKNYIYYDKYKTHTIEISRWVMDLNDNIIKNTIMHEIIHCMPKCNNHGTEFKQYAKYINQKLGYDISRTGNKKEDYEKSNLKYNDDTQKYKYKIVCKKCGQTCYRQRISKDFTKKYRCSLCARKIRSSKIKIKNT